MKQLIAIGLIVAAVTVGVLSTTAGMTSASTPHYYVSDGTYRTEVASCEPASIGYVFSIHHITCEKR